MRIVDVSSLDCVVYVELEDGTIIRSRPLGNKLCAELHAAQITDLSLTVEFLVFTLGFVEEII